MDKESLSYKKGFSKGIEICNTNIKNSGYYADDISKNAIYENYSKYKILLKSLITTTH